MTIYIQPSKNLLYPWINPVYTLGLNNTQFRKSGLDLNWEVIKKTLQNTLGEWLPGTNPHYPDECDLWIELECGGNDGLFKSWDTNGRPNLKVIDFYKKIIHFIRLVKPNAKIGIYDWPCKHAQVKNLDDYHKACLVVTKELDYQMPDLYWGYSQWTVQRMVKDTSDTIDRIYRINPSANICPFLCPYTLYDHTLNPPVINHFVAGKDFKQQLDVLTTKNVDKALIWMERGNEPESFVFNEEDEWFKEVALWELKNIDKKVSQKIQELSALDDIRQHIQHI